MFKSTLKTTSAAACLAFAAALSGGQAEALTLGADTGWFLFVTNPSIGDASTTISFNLATAGQFTIVDACHGGYAYEIFSGGASQGTTSTTGSFSSACNFTTNFADQHVADPIYDVGAFSFAAGNHELTVKTIIDGGPGANRSFVRLDSVISTVPLPAGAFLAGTALLGLGWAGRRKAV